VFFEQRHELVELFGLALINERAVQLQIGLGPELLKFDDLFDVGSDVLADIVAEDVPGPVFDIAQKLLVVFQIRVELAVPIVELVEVHELLVDGRNRKVVPDHVEVLLANDRLLLEHLLDVVVNLLPVSRKQLFRLLLREEILFLLVLFNLLLKLGLPDVLRVLLDVLRNLHVELGQTPLLERVVFNVDQPLPRVPEQQGGALLLAELLELVRHVAEDLIEVRVHEVLDSQVDVLELDAGLFAVHLFENLVELGLDKGEAGLLDVFQESLTDLLDLLNNDLVLPFLRQI